MSASSNLRDLALEPFDRNWALFFDVDGTLVDFRVRPEEVEVTHELKRLLRSLKEQLGGAMALISGRALRDLEAMFGINDLAMAGLHGIELRNGEGSDDVRVQTVDHAALDRFRQRIALFAEGHEALIVEDKGLGIALHYRQAPELKDAVEAMLEETLAGQESFRIQRGKMLAEIKARSADKGFAIRELMGYKRFDGRRPVFLGDDETDEDGFAVVNEMAGFSVKVGDGTTRARYRLAAPDAVLDWLADYERYLINGE